MIFLFIHVFAVALFSICYKVARHKEDCETPAVQLAMYFFATIISVVLASVYEGLIFNWYLIAIGVVGGISLLTAIRTFFYAMRQGGLAVGWTLVNMSVAMPVIVSIFLWKEYPSAYQIVGLLLMFPCIILFGDLSFHVDRGDPKRWAILVIVASVTTGFAMIANMMVSHLARTVPELQSQQLVFNYLAWVFGICVVAQISMGDFKKWQLKSTENKIGTLMGFLNLLGAWSFIKTLEYLPGTVFFPMKAVCGVLLTALLAVIIWKEKLTRRQIIGIIIGAIAALLVNIKN